MRTPMRLLSTSVMTLCAAGCFTSSEGREPNPNRFHYPTGLVASPGGTVLYVANSDFDLEFAGGTVQALDLGQLRGLMQALATSLADTSTSAASACAANGLGGNGDPWLNPGPCAPVTICFAGNPTGEPCVAPVLRAAASIGAFASGVVLVHDPDGDGARLFVPVRGDPSVTYFDVDDDRDQSGGFRLDCGLAEDGFCDDAHRLGQDREHTLRGVQLPPDPVGIAASADGTAIVTAHQTQRSASLVTNDWATIPALAFNLGDLADGPTELATIPTPAFSTRMIETDPAYEHRPGFALTFRAAPQIDILRYVPDAGAVPPRPFIVRAFSAAVTATISAEDSRGIAIVDTERRACEASCADDLACLRSCAEQVPLRVYMANRRPASLVVGRIETEVNDSGTPPEPTSAVDSVFFHQSVALAFGASRIEVGRIVLPDGTLAERVFAVAFDSRAIFVLDPTTDRVETVIRTGRGPHDIAFDAGTDDTGETHAYLYIGHFTDSYLGVVDLDRRRPQTYGQMIASVGTPIEPPESR
jgi:hypothetical protein